MYSLVATHKSGTENQACEQLLLRQLGLDAQTHWGMAITSLLDASIMAASVLNSSIVYTTSNTFWRGQHGMHQLLFMIWVAGRIIKTSLQICTNLLCTLGLQTACDKLKYVQLITCSKISAP